MKSELKNFFKKKLFVFKKKILPCSENNFRPLFLKGSFLFTFLLALFFLKMIVLVFSLQFPKSLFFAEIVSSTLIEFTNKERQLIGLPPLRKNPLLEEAAFLKAKDILENDYFSHQSPQGVSPWYWFKKAGYNYQIAGENLAIGFFDSEEVFRAWKESGTHHQNLLNSRFQDVGIAVLKGEFQGNETTVVVQFFGSPQPQTVLPGTIPEAEAKEETASGKSKESMPGEDLKEEKIESEPISVLPESIIAAEETGQLPEKSFQFRFWEFVTKKYDEIISRFILYSVIITISFLVFNFFIALGNGFYHKDLLPKTFLLIGFLFLSTLLDKTFLINIIPHALKIY